MKQSRQLTQNRSKAIEALASQVARIVRESGEPRGFDAREWVLHWIEVPQPALGGKRPRELMSTTQGRQLVSDLIARQQAGTYT
jgi:uncharacterized protein (DUF2384 family)